MRDRMQLVTLQKLRIFAAVAKEGSFARAADAIYMSSPTVSEEIRSLETMVGLKLINRSRGVRHLELTEAGQILVEGYDETSQSLANVAKALDAIRGLQRGTVAFGADVIFGGYLLPALHHSFCQDHPGISVQVEIDKPQRILESLRSGQMDIAVPVRSQRTAVAGAGAPYSLLHGPDRPARTSSIWQRACAFQRAGEGKTGLAWSF